MNVNEKMISVVEQTNRGERQYDLASRLLEDRIIFLSGEVNTDLANYIIAQLIYLEARDPHKDIALYINSPGGSVTDGMAIFDTMNYIKCDVSTISIGLSASMGAFLLAAAKLANNFHLLSDEAGLKRITIHGLRHSHVSLLISKKYDIFEVSKRIGHKSVKTTQDIYGHLFDDVQKSIANDLDKLRRGA